MFDRIAVSISKIRTIPLGTPLVIEGHSEHELGQFGLGNTWTLRNYSDITGIDCVNKKVTQAAQSGKPIIVNEMRNKNILETESQDQTGAGSIIDVTINTMAMEPLVLACEENAPILTSLYVALQNKNVNPDNMIYLQIGEDGEETVFFKQKDLVSIETSPALSEAFFSALPALAQQESDPTDQQFSDEWKIWIWDNIGRGCSKESIFKQLIEHGFTWQSVRTELNFEPTVPLDQIKDPSDDTLISSDYQANSMARQIASSKLEIYQIDDVLNKQECDTLIAMISDSSSRSKVVGDTGDIESNARTSSSCTFEDSDEQRMLAKDIRSRLCRLVGINESYAERIQGQLYGAGGEYKAHYDWFEPGTPVFDHETVDSKGGQRTWTIIVYLNEVEKGGETHFGQAKITVQPMVGRAVLWNNLDAKGEPNHDAIHQACPVLAGQKAILTVWFRSLPIDGSDNAMFINN